MKRIVLGSLVSVAATFLLLGCSTPDVPGIGTVSNSKECPKINNELVKVNDYIARVEPLPASQVAELAMTVPQLTISTSANKKEILRDARRKKAELESAQSANGCPEIKTK